MQLDQLSIAGIANSDPSTRRTIVACAGEGQSHDPLVTRIAEREMAFIQNLLVGPLPPTRGRSREPPDGRLGAMPLPARAEAARRPERASLFRRDDGMVRLTGSKGQNRIDVRGFKIRILLKNRLYPDWPADINPKNLCDRNAQAANTWTAMPRSVSIVILFKRSGQWQHHLPTIAPSVAFVRAMTPQAQSICIALTS